VGQAAVVAVVAAEAGGNHDNIAIIFRQKIHGGENNVFLYQE
jgi:hypothetical protein